VQHKVETRDAQPSGDGNALVVMVTGALMVSCGAGSQEEHGRSARR
jgi:hypothetical protein